MKEYVIKFLHRGLIFGGLGCIVAGIIYFFISRSLDISFTGDEVLLAILSGYFLAFIHAGASVFNQIEEWSPAKSLFIHLGTLYLTYSFFYLINSWLPFEPMALLIFTAAFVLLYLAVWGAVYLSIKAAAKRLGKKIDR